MAQILVRQIDDSVMARIKVRAKAMKRSTEAEVREILSAAVAPKKNRHKPLLSLIGAGRPGRSQAEIDAYVRSLRDEWDD